MNISRQSNMGAILNIFTNTNFDETDDDDDKESCIYHEASPEIRVLVIYEQPQGTGLHMTLTIDPTNTAESFKRDLANVINVPAEFIHLIHLNVPLEDNKTLLHQGVEPNNTIVLRDNRLIYTFP